MNPKSPPKRPAPSSNQPLFLCGMMGSGKSTVGRLLAKKLDLRFVDLDEEIEKSEKMSISNIFEQKGEKAFRRIEKEQVCHYAKTSGTVIALGGGTLQNQQTVNLLKENGLLIFLDAPHSVLSSRLSHDSQRPLLEQGDEKQVRNKIKKLFEERRKFYLQSHINVDTGRKSPGLISDIIVQKLSKHES